MPDRAIPGHPGPRTLVRSVPAGAKPGIVGQEGDVVKGRRGLAPDKVWGARFRSAIRAISKTEIQPETAQRIDLACEPDDKHEQKHNGVDQIPEPLVTQGKH